MGSSGRRRVLCLLRYAAALGLLALSGAVLLPKADASTELLAPGKVHDLLAGFGPYPALPRAPGTPIRGYGFVARVTEEDCAPSVGAYPDAVAAPAGDEVCAFFLRLGYVAPQFVAVEGGLETVLSVAVVAGRSKVPLSGHDLGDAGQAVFALDVPSGSAPTLEFSEAGLNESWSLTAGRLVGAVPAVLSGRSLLSLPSGERFSLSESDLEGVATAKLDCTVTSARLTWFEPGHPTVHPPSPNEAFLVLQFSSREVPGPSGAAFGDFEPLSGSDVRVELPGGAIKDTRVDAESAVGLLEYPYSAVVPAGTRGVELLVTPGVELGARLGSGTFMPTSVRFGSATVALGEPASPGEPAPAGPVPAAHLRGERRAVLAVATGLSPVVPVAAAGGGVTVLVVVLPFFLRGRRGKRLVVEFPAAMPLDPAPPAHAGPDWDAGLEASGRLVVRVLGPVEVEGLAEGTRPVVVELAVLLALKGRAVDAGELRTLLGGERDLSAQTLYNRVNQLKKALGKEVLVRKGPEGYVFEGEVSTDVASFEELRKRAEAANDEVESAAFLLEALRLVRGVPFSAVAPGSYRWALDSGEAAEMGNAVESVAVRAADRLVRVGRILESREAARLGLRAQRYSRPLYERLLRCCKTKAELEELWAEVVANLGDDRGLAEVRDGLLASVTP
ncbi:MAG: bacterial transcriptional activator domain-containing protein [Actinomycetota bacterium]|nr:bacterial transcriptional activator domain-containing protein [Actinomycetota bacterium]